MHTMYVDKTMQGAGLMQAIARVNRTFRDKPGGLIVDYIGVFSNLQKALVEYSPSDRDQAGVPIEEIVAAMLEKHDIVARAAPRLRLRLRPRPCRRPAARPARRRCSTSSWPTPTAQKRFLDQVLALLKAFALAGARDEAARDPQRRPPLRRRPRRDPQDPEPRLRARRLAAPSRSTPPSASSSTRPSRPTRSSTSTSCAGVETPELSILSDEFLDSLAHKDKPNLQMGLLRRLLNDQIKTARAHATSSRRRKFSEQLEEAINRYTNRSLTTAEIIAELVKLAKEMRDQAHRHEELGLREAEAAFYDAIVRTRPPSSSWATTCSRRSPSTWSGGPRVRHDRLEPQGVRPRRDARQGPAAPGPYGYPPDAQEEAVQLVLEQAELLGTSVTA